MKYNYFFIEIGIYRSRFDTQYIYPAKIFFYLANIIIDQAFNVWALVQETTGSIPLSALCSLGQLVSSESVEMSEWGVCVGCPWHDTPVREHSKTATSGYRRDMTYQELK